MTCKPLKGVLRGESRLVGKLASSRVLGPSGVYIDGSFQGEANGWYNDNLPGMVPVGLWDASGNRTDANGLYENNIKITMSDGLWVAEVYQGPVHGYYQHNAPATMDPGLWIDNTYEGIVNGWYVNNARVTLLNGLWVDEVYQGAVNGWYVDNALAVMATGIWEGNVFREIATGLYDNNVKITMQSGLWVDEEYKGKVTGYYVENVKTKIPDGCYRGGGLVDPYYERIRDAALAEGGGLYLFQLEHGQYAGEQVIWQEMAEINPWVPGLLTPQGKTYDLMGSGEYLGQSVSMRRPVDGVFDGVNSFLVASSMAIGDVLHQYGGSAWFLGADLTPTSTRRLLGTCQVTGDNGIHVRTQPASTAIYRRKDNEYEGLSTINKNVGDYHVMGVVVNAVGSMQPVVDGALFDGATAAPSPYLDKPADSLLHVGSSPDGGSPCPGTYQYIAIYTREPTEYEISLHKRTPS